jgi:hypothetical protein
MKSIGLRNAAVETRVYFAGRADARRCPVADPDFSSENRGRTFQSLGATTVAPSAS